MGRRFGVLLSILLCSVAGFAQQTAAVQPAGAVSAPTRISLDVVVMPKGGKPVADLTQQDFTVLDNKVAQPITSFRAVVGSGAPVEVIVVIDAINTAYTAIAYERGEIGKFLRANNAQLAYPTALAVISDTSTQMQNGFSKDGNVLIDALDHYTVSLRTIERSAGFYGADERLSLSIQALREIVARAATLPGRKLVLWISPGWPILSGPNVQLTAKQQQNIFDIIVKVSTELRQAHITLYSIDPLGTVDIGMRTFYYQDFLKGIRKPKDTQLGNLALQVIATQSGGLALNSSNDIAGLLQQAVMDSEAYYELSFDPVRGEPDEYHQIDVKVSKPGLIVRTRTGYYSPR
jgi:VWFA-related protein